jgi:hypothetical protein
MNFRIPKQLKDQFQQTCRRNQSFMTSELVRLVTHYLIEESKVHEVLQAPDVIKQVPVIRQPAPTSIQSWESSY